MTSRSKLSAVTFGTCSCCRVFTGFPSCSLSSKLSRCLYAPCAFTVVGKQNSCQLLNSCQLTCSTNDDKAPTGTGRLSHAHGYDAMAVPDRVAVNILTRCQDMLTSGCDNRLATCDPMEDLVSGLPLDGRDADEPHLNRLDARGRTFIRLH
jgi:hypothetical protein